MINERLLKTRQSKVNSVKKRSNMRNCNKLNGRRKTNIRQNKIRETRGNLEAETLRDKTISEYKFRLRITRKLIIINGNIDLCNLE